MRVYNPPVAALEPGVFFPPIALFDSETEGKRAPFPIPKGRTLYAFFKTSCPTCVLTWPYLERVRALAEGGPLRVVAVSQDEPGATRDFNSRLGSRIETVYDPQPWKASAAVGLTNVPTLFLVDEEGRIRDTVVGFQKKKIEELGRLAAEGTGREGTAVFRPEDGVPDLKPG